MHYSLFFGLNFLRKVKMKIIQKIKKTLEYQSGFLCSAHLNALNDINADLRQGLNISLPWKAFEKISVGLKGVEPAGNNTSFQVTAGAVTYIKRRIEAILQEEKKIINLTQHQASVEQKKAGVTDLLNNKILKKLLTFNNAPTKNQMLARANEIAKIAKKAKTSHAMIGGAPFFMSFLERALVKQNIQPLYAFTKRTVTEENGVKKSIFRHEAFIKVEI